MFALRPGQVNPLVTSSSKLNIKWIPCDLGFLYKKNRNRIITNNDCGINVYLTLSKEGFEQQEQVLRVKKIFEAIIYFKSVSKGKKKHSQEALENSKVVQELRNIINARTLDKKSIF